MGRRHPLIGLSILLAALAWQGACAEEENTPADETTKDAPFGAVRVEGDSDSVVAKLYGALVYTKISVTLDHTPARDALREIQREIRVPIFGRFSDDPPGYGIDPEIPITIDAHDVPALGVLEEFIGQCEADGGPACTWQIRKSFIEVGTKGRLSVPAARERRAYYIGDLIIDPVSAGKPRQRREVIALEVIEEVCENVEPGSWDYGQVDYEEGAEPDIISRTPGEASSQGDDEDDAPKASRPKVMPRRYVTGRKTAIIRYWRDLLIIVAPDYIHRQIGGYPTPIPPQGEGADAPAPAGQAPAGSSPPSDG